MANVRSNPLCCCEYIDSEGEKNHILACCCNCGALDSAVDSVICCRNKHKRSWDRIMRVLEDRLRVPWMGGAKRLSLDSALPVILLPAVLILSAQSAICTSITFPATPFIIFQIHKSYLQYIPQTQFYCNFMYTSFFFIFIIYEFLVVPFLEISQYENLSIICVSFVAAVSFYKTKTVQGRIPIYDEEYCEPSVSTSKAETCSSCGIVAAPRSSHCRICQTCIPKREVHCLWFGCCIGSHNLQWFLLCLISLAVALIFSSNLILTTVCRPVPFWGPVLVPEDCSEVYYEFRFAVCFVSGLYSIVISVVVLWALLRHCWLVTLGITGDEWRSLTLAEKCRLGISANRPYSHGPILNWFQFFKCKNGNY